MIAISPISSNSRYPDNDGNLIIELSDREVQVLRSAPNVITTGGTHPDSTELWELGRKIAESIGLKSEPNLHINFSNLFNHPNVMEDNAVFNLARSVGYNPPQAVTDHFFISLRDIDRGQLYIPTGKSVSGSYITEPVKKNWLRKVLAELLSS